MISNMKVTFILKNKSEFFYDKLKGIENSNVFEWLKSQNIYPKIGNDTLGEKIEFNTLYKDGGKFNSPVIMPRRGYKLLTINLS